MKEVTLTELGATPSVGEWSASKSSHSDFWGNVFACFVPMLMFVDLNLVGRLFLSEILLLCMLPLLLVMRGKALLAPLPRKLILFGLAWLLSQIVTDVIMDTPFEDWSRGWAKIIFLLLNFSAIYLFLNGKEKRFFLFAAGIAAGQILTYFFNPSVFVEDYPWKFGYGLAVTSFFVLATQIGFVVFLGGRYWQSAIILFMGMLNLYFDFRSLGVICLLVGVFVFVNNSKRIGLGKIKLRKLAMLFFIGTVSIYTINSLYNYGAADGWFGREVKEKYLWQSVGDMGVLLGGRSEILASSQAVIDSPFIGHGSWAKDQKYIAILQDSLLQHGYAFAWMGESDLIPSHSYIMGAWVEAGIGGAIFWFWCVLLAARALVATYGSNMVLTPLIAFVAFGLLWNIPFSPFGAQGRLNAAYDLSLMIFALTSSRVAMATKGRA